MQIRGMALFIVVLTILLTTCSGQDYKITQFNSSSGLYYEQIGKVLLSNNNWQFVTSIDYKGYLLFYEYLKQQVTKLEDFCNDYEIDNCEGRLDNIRTTLARIEETDGVMSGLLGIERKPKRVRRFVFLFGFGLGALLSGIISSSNQPDMSVYDQQISSLRNGQMEIVNQMNLQTTLFTADAERKKVQIEWLKKTQTHIQTKLLSLEENMAKDSKEKSEQIDNLRNMLSETNKKLEEQGETQKKILKNVKLIEDKLLGVEKNLDTLTKLVSKQGKTLYATYLNVKFNSLTIDINFIFDQFENDQKKLFEIIKRAKKGELDPYVLTPLNLIEMLQEIIPKMKETEKFPFYPNIENAHFLYNMITPNVYFHNYSLFFILKIPTVNIKSFDFFKITSLPAPAVPNIFTFVLPKNPYLLIDQYYQEYLTMPFQQYTDFCKPLDKYLYFCKQTQPLFSVHTDPSCEVSLLISTRYVPNSCDKRMVFLKDILFLQLMETNSWIYLSPAAKSIVVNCNSKRHNVIMEGSGLIHLSSSCEIRFNSFKLKSLSAFTTPVEMNYTSPAKLNDFISLSYIENMQQEIKVNPKKLILPFDFDELADISIPVENVESYNNYFYFFLLLPILLIIPLFIYRQQVKLLISKLFVRINARNEENKLKTINETEKNDPSETDTDSECPSVPIRTKITRTITDNNTPTPHKPVFLLRLGANAPRKNGYGRHEVIHNRRHTSAI